MWKSKSNKFWSFGMFLMALVLVAFSSSSKARKSSFRIILFEAEMFTVLKNESINRVPDKIHAACGRRGIPPLKTNLSCYEQLGHSTTSISLSHAVLPAQINQASAYGIASPAIHFSFQISRKYFSDLTVGVRRIFSKGGNFDILRIYFKIFVWQRGWVK